MGGKYEDGDPISYVNVVVSYVMLLWRRYGKTQEALQKREKQLRGFLRIKRLRLRWAG